MPLKASFDRRPGDDEKGCLEPREPLEKLCEREDEEDEDKLHRQGPKVEAVEADCFPPFSEERFFSNES